MLTLAKEIKKNIEKIDLYFKSITTSYLGIEKEFDQNERDLLDLKTTELVHELEFKIKNLKSTTKVHESVVYYLEQKLFKTLNYVNKIKESRLKMDLDEILQIKEPIQRVEMEQEQEFDSENLLLIESLESNLTRVREAETKLLEIQRLQQDIAHHLDFQNETLHSLWSDAGQQTQQIQKGNMELQRTLNNGQRLWFLCSVILLSLVLLFLDAIN